MKLNKNREIRVSDSVNFWCEVTGDPRPVVRWLHNGKFIDLMADRFFPQDHSGLKIRSARESDNGNYTCRAKNKYGEISYNYTLKVKGNSSSLRTLSISSGLT